MLAQHNPAVMERLGALLVIDDDADVLASARLALARHVERIDLAGTVEDGVALAATASYDCVLLDMNFAAGMRRGEEGLSTLERIRAADPSAAVVMMTAFGAVTLAVTALKLGASDFLLKPWKNEALLAAVYGAAAQTRAARAPMSLDARERDALVEQLARNRGNVARTARSLGLSRPALYRRMEKHGL